MSRDLSAKIDKMSRDLSAKIDQVSSDLSAKIVKLDLRVKLVGILNIVVYFPTLIPTQYFVL